MGRTVRNEGERTYMSEGVDVRVLRRRRSRNDVGGNNRGTKENSLFFAFPEKDVRVAAG